MSMPPRDPQAEQALIARLQKGDEQAFVSIYRAHRDSVYRFALMYCGAPATAADVTQDTFMHLMAKPGQFDATRGSIGAWLCGVARMIARRQMGEQREVPHDPADLHDEFNPAPGQVDHETPLDRVLKSEAAEHVRDAVARLAPHYRDVLILCELTGLSYAEAAQVCGVEIGTVRSRLSRARSALAQRLARFHLGAKEAV